MKYASMLAERMERHGTRAWLVNTGWTGGRRARPAAAAAAAPAGRRSAGARPFCPAPPTPAPPRFHPPLRSYGVGQRMSLRHTRAIVDAIHSGELERAEAVALPLFGLQASGAPRGAGAARLGRGGPA